MNVIVSIRVKRLLTMIIMSFAFLTKWNGEKFPWYSPYLICLPLYVTLGISFFNDSYRDKNTSKTVFLAAITPYSFALVYSFILWILGESIVDSGLRAVTVSARAAAEFFLAAIIVSYFEEDAIDLIADALILSYIWSIQNALSNIGLKGLFDYISTVAYSETKLNSWFEMHDVGLSVGFLLIYELLFARKRSLFKSIFLVVILLLCWKRIALLATLIVGAILLVIKGEYKNYKLSLILNVGVVLCFVYVLLISSGTLYTIAGRYGISFNNRKYMYTFVSNLYEWKFSYLGHGLGSVGKYMTNLVGTRAGARIKGMKAVHNDILKTYIELGFGGSLLWFMWYSWSFPKILGNRIGSISRYVYCLVMIYALIVYTTDNTSEYFIFQMILYSLILYGCYWEVGENREWKWKEQKNSDEEG